MGKCIGGGAPLECKRGVFDIAFYLQDLTKGPVPNDDLDLQLVWLNAVEKYGRNINSSILGEYWQSFIIQNWSEYGTDKNNMRMGLQPPLSGSVENPNKDSCGSFNRSEIWACLAPGHPEIAVQYAFEDASVDHAREGLFGEIFFAAIQSAAFVETETETLIAIGLSYIPTDCAISKAVQLAQECYTNNLSWQDARKKILQDSPGSFGALGTSREEMEEDEPVGEIGWDAPSNIAITVMAWLYGENDFGKSLRIAAGCGEDADCTAGTLGAILGIIRRIDGIPSEWKDAIGDDIATLCINDKEHTSEMSFDIPHTVTDLTERILRLTPIFLGSEWCDILSVEGVSILALTGSDLFYKARKISYWEQDSFLEKIKRSGHTTSHDFVIMKASLDYHEQPTVQAGQKKTFTLRIENACPQQQWLDIIWHLPETWLIKPGKKISQTLSHRIIGTVSIDFIIEIPEVLEESRYDLLVEIRSNGRHTKGFIPVVLLHTAS